MCGIVGFCGSGDRQTLISMSRALAHRGPDGEGFYIDDATRLHLGHRRLAIIDLAGGSQPMGNEDGSVQVVFNGEIYNHVELRRELVAAGHVFHSDHADTEVLVHGYEEWGEDLPGRLNGMFAFAVYDRRARRLMLARDRFGEKPLYYVQRPGFIAFASEIHSLRRHPECAEIRLSPRSLQRYFAFGYVPAPDTLFEGVTKLPGGHVISLDLETFNGSPRQYWRFAIVPDDKTDDDDALAEELRGLIIQGVKRRLISDVPLGIFLSGGMDSSSVLAAAIQALPATRFETFTIGFNEPSYDETEPARQVAQAFGTRHHDAILGFEDAKALLPDVLSRIDGPIADGSILPTFLLSRFTREHVTVALSGDGGDELFAGYDPFKALLPAVFYDRLVPRGLHRGLRRLADLLPISDANMSLSFKLRRALTGLSYPAPLWNPVWLAPANATEMAEIFDEPLSAEDLYSDVIMAWEAAAGRNIVDKTLEFYTNFYLPNDILAKVDQASMLCSLETRAAFLDNDVVAFCSRLPSRFKYHRGERKFLLRKAMAPLLPPAVLDRRKKGFGIPAVEWLRELPPPPALAGIGVKTDRLMHFWTQHRAKSHDHRLMLWAWLSLQLSLSGVHHTDRSPQELPRLSLGATNTPAY